MFAGLILVEHIFSAILIPTTFLSFVWHKHYFYCLGKKKKMKRLVSLAIAVLMFTLSANAVVVQNLTGHSPTGDAIAFEARLTISGNILTLRLSNNSPFASTSPDDLLSSYFFGINNSLGQIPNLVLQSANGDVYLTKKDSADSLQTLGANLIAVKKGDDTWKYLPLNVNYYPFLYLGLSTVGNSALNPNNFPGNIVGDIDYSIYTGDIYTQNLSDRLLVKNSATFVFSGLAGFTEADILDSYGFGLGTAPDTVVTHIPEPATMSILALGTLILVRRK